MFSAEKTFYFSFIRPILEYADVLLTNLTESDSLKMEKVKKRAGKIVSGAIKGTSYDVIINELGWEPLNVRRNRSQLLFFSDIVYNHTPSFFVTTCLLPYKPGLTIATN